MLLPFHLGMGGTLSSGDENRRRRADRIGQLFANRSSKNYDH